MKPALAEIRRAILINRPEYPTEFVDEELNIYINLGAYPPDLSFNDVVFQITRAIVTETICYYARQQSKHKKWQCGLDCIPNIFAIKTLDFIGLNCKENYFK